MGIRADLKGQRAYFDSNIFIYLMEGFAGFEDVLADIRQSILNREADVLSSELSLCEVLVAPFRASNAELAKTYRNFLETSGAFQLVPTSREIYVSASFLRAEARLKTADAIHVATAVQAGCTVFVSNDLDIRLPKGLRHIKL
jgi:predicted nucleic acid-binding protein